MGITFTRNESKKGREWRGSSPSAPHSYSTCNYSHAVAHGGISAHLKEHSTREVPCGLQCIMGGARWGPVHAAHSHQCCSGFQRPPSTCPLVNPTVPYSIDPHPASATKATHDIARESQCPALYLSKTFLVL